MKQENISRKNFIKLVGASLLGFGFTPKMKFDTSVEFPNYEKLGRVCIIGKVDIKSAPYEDSETIGVL